MKETRGNKENKFMSNVLYAISVLTIIFAGISAACLLIPDPFPVVDELIAIKASLLFLVLFVVSFLAASSSSKDGSGEEFVGNMSKAGGIFNILVTVRKLVE